MTNENQTNGDRFHGELWVDIRDYGAIPDDGTTDNSGPIQAAIDDLASRLKTAGFGSKGVVFIPSAPQAFAVAKTVWIDSPNIEIRGEGWGSTLKMYGNDHHNLLQFGIRRTETANINGVPTSLQIDSTNRPDLFGKLDTSVVSSQNQMWGLRTNSNSYVLFQTDSMAFGPSIPESIYYCDHWSQTPKLTLEFCIEPPDGELFPPERQILGIGDIAQGSSPFMLRSWSDPGSILVSFRTSDIGSGYGLPDRSFGFSVLNATKPYRIAIQFDLDNAVCTAYVNGVQVDLTAKFNLTPDGPYPFLPGSRFQQNDFYPFMIGVDGARGKTNGENTGIDLRVYAYRSSKGLRYQNNGAGKPQTRIDNPDLPINDSYAYFAYDSTLINYLAFQDNPATSGRVVTVVNGNSNTAGGFTSGIFLHTWVSLFQTGNAVRDLQAMGANGHGQVISLGNVVDFAISNVKATGGFHSVGGINLFVVYTVTLDNCTLGGFDSSYYGHGHIVNATGIQLSQAGVATIRQVGGQGVWKNVFVAAAGPAVECVYKFHTSDNGGVYSIDNLIVDFEGESVKLCGIYCEASRYNPGTSLRTKDVTFGTVGAGKSLVMLRDMGPQSNDLRPSWFSSENLQTYDPTCTVLDIDGPLWHGEVIGIGYTCQPLTHRKKWSDVSHIVVRDLRHIAPPREHAWVAGGHCLEVRSPVSGQFTEWRCATSGTYGTANPPVWVGMAAMIASKPDLAAYMANHCYITANLS